MNSLIQEYQYLLILKCCFKHVFICSHQKIGMYAPPIIDRFAVEVRMRGAIHASESLNDCQTLTEKILTNVACIMTGRSTTYMQASDIYSLSRAVFTVDSLESELVARPALNRETFVRMISLRVCRKRFVKFCRFSPFLLFFLSFSFSSSLLLSVSFWFSQLSFVESVQKSPFWGSKHPSWSF